MNKVPLGVSRNRHVEVTTRGGNNTVAGYYVREKDEQLYLKFEHQGNEATVVVDLADVEILVIGPKKDDGADEPVEPTDTDA